MAVHPDLAVTLCGRSRQSRAIETADRDSLHRLLRLVHLFSDDRGKKQPTFRRINRNASRTALSDER